MKAENAVFFMPADLADRILGTLEEKPRSISEIARELDEETYEVGKKIEVLDEEGRINTYKVGRSTVCILPREDGGAREAEPEPETAPPEEPEPRAPREETPDAMEQPDTGVSDAPRPQGQDTAAQDPSAGRQAADPTPQRTADPEPADEPEREPARDMAAAAAAAAEGAATGPVRRVPPGAEQGEPRTIGIVSGKGGVGKTVVTLNLGAALMDLGEEVIVMDADAEMPNLGIHLGIYTYPTSLEQVVDQDVHIMSAMHVDKDSGLRVLPTALSAERDQGKVGDAIGMIPHDYTVLIDSPPGYERPVERVIETCDELIFVTSPEVPALADTYKLYKQAVERGKEPLGVIINMYSSSKNHLSVAEVENALEMPVLGVIPKSDLVPRSILDNQPVVSMKPYAKVSREFKKIAADLAGHHYEETLLDRVKGVLP